METNKYSLILVEDSDDDLILFEWALKRTGLNETFEILRHFPTGDEAVRYFDQPVDSELRPDIILLDVKLPGRSGFEVLKWMQVLSPKPVIAMLTSSDLAEDKGMAYKLGADLFQTKNYDVNEFSRFLNCLGGIVDARRNNGS